AAPSVGAAVIAAPAGREAEVEAAAEDARGAGELSLTVVAGGATRAASVGAGLAEVRTDIVAVHDAARPLLTVELIESLLRLLGDRPDAAGAIAARPIADTVKRVSDAEGRREIERTESREGLWAAETPQVFRTDALRRAHSADEAASATDDAMLVERMGGTVLVESAPHPNLKVTTAADARLAELLLGA
ncbi:MAG TPA: 2-C-methyl-D-erythritol 4-phosphate cytidylyltransferase, partial [Solirubrobacterales bacterium]|nr:2-C-methyl-D-erythritol 4-phosphate cytidylyltransferase [Solirubrobacterales bacterium]